MDYNVFYRFPEPVCVYLSVLLAIFTKRFDKSERDAKLAANTVINLCICCDFFIDKHIC